MDGKEFPLLKKILLFPVKLVYTAWFDLVMLLMHVLGIPIALVLLPLGQVKIVRWIERRWVFTLFLLGGKILRVSGRENAEKGHAYVIIANHSSFYDIHTLLGLFPAMGFLAKKSLFSIPLIRQGLRVSNSVPIDRGDLRSTVDALNQLIEQTQGDFTLGIFPEGTRTKTGALGTFKRGFVRILRESGMSLLPVTLKGYYQFKPKNRRLLDPFARLEAVIHPPLGPEELANMTDAEIVEKAREIITAAM
jgi:1-acyl-sn-glycerol-3-phosphate acyltransferase